MSTRYNRLILIFSLLGFLIPWTTPADEVLVNVQSINLPELVRENCAVRFRGSDFLLVQGDEGQFAEASVPYTVLDRVEPGAVYYLVMVGQTGSFLPRLEGLGEILLRFGDSVLLRIEPSEEVLLIGTGLPLAPLPESVKLYPQKRGRMAPKLKSPSEAAADAAIVSDIVNAVSADALRESIYDLQENKDLDPPYTAFKSRYCLRVRETDDPSDDACDNAADYIYNRFRSYGLEVEFDPFPHEVLTQGHYQMRNIVATLPGKGANSERIFVICAHYDSIASNSTNWLLKWKTMPAPGADDNASGAAAVLEAARILSEYDFESTIRFITFSGEELGLHGSKHYARMVAEGGEEIAGVLNFDMIAYDPDVPDIDIITDLCSEWLVDAMLSIQRTYNISPLTLIKIVNPEMVYSDHAPFWQNGYDAILGIDNSDFESPEFYPQMHTTEDTIDKLNMEIAARMVQIAVGALASLADPMGGVPHPDLAVFEDDIRLSPENPRHGDLVQVTADIFNNGETDAERVHVQILLLEPLSSIPRLVSTEVVDVQAGGAAQVSAFLELEEWGDHTVLVKANPNYWIFETNGSNNIAGKDIHVGSTSLALGKLMLYPNPVRSSSEARLNIAYTLSKDASARLDIYSAFGELVYRRYFTSGESGGKFGPNDEIEWDGRNLSGEEVSAGVYFCYVVATDHDNTASTSGKLLFIK